MQKVIIADDEAKVCKLISLLIDWNALDMEIAAIAHNGIDVLKLITIYNPDLIITDIRMPGYDGLEMIRRAKELNNELEFIIISGYRHFDYAQSAIKYGVSDYLLKPIKKTELTNTLIKMKEKFSLKNQKFSKIQSPHYLFKSDLEKLRSGLFIELLFNKEAVTSEISYINANRDYHYNFNPGIFQIAVIKPDVGYQSQFDNSIKILIEKISQISIKNLEPLCYEIEFFWQDCYGFCILNYATEEKKNIRKSFKTILDELLLQRVIFENLQVTISLGAAEEDFSNIKNSLSTAKSAIHQRLLIGTGKIIEDIPLKNSNLNDIPIYHLTCRTLTDCLETLDKDSISKLLLGLKSSLKTYPNINGDLVIKFSKSILSTFSFVLRKNGLIINNEESFIEETTKRLERCGSVDSIFDFLSIQIESVLSEIIESKNQAEKKPIRQAKQYIQKNYMNPISLDEVSNAVGFNTSYFSSLFKKITDQNFLEYLSEVRMEKAKELLKETNFSVAEICENVGYRDIKHFTKTFSKHTGLKPSEFRKLYS